MNGIIYNLQDAACEPCAVPVSLYVGCFTVSHPCSSGSIAPGTPVTFTITNAAPSTTYTVRGPGGSSFTMTTNPARTATSAPVVVSGISPEHRTWEVQANNTTIWATQLAVVCVTQPCGPGVPVPDAVCVDNVVTPPTITPGDNANMNPGGPATCSV